MLWFTHFSILLYEPCHFWFISGATPYASDYHALRLSNNVHQKIIPNSAEKKVLEIHFRLSIATQNKKNNCENLFSIINTDKLINNLFLMPQAMITDNWIFCVQIRATLSYPIVQIQSDPMLPGSFWFWVWNRYK